MVKYTPGSTTTSFRSYLFITDENSSSILSAFTTDGFDNIGSDTIIVSNIKFLIFFLHLILAPPIYIYSYTFYSIFNYNLVNNIILTQK